MTLDHVNAAFELIGSVLLWLIVLQALRDRRMRGVSPWPSVFFSVWGAWNLFFYPALGQGWSAVAGIGALAANTSWLVLWHRYRRA